MRRHVLTTAALLTAVLVSACSGSDDPTKPAATKTPSTWATPYVDTTCEQWINDMSQAQNLDAANQFLLQAWKSDDVTDKTPPVDLVKDFKAAITDQCKINPTDGVVVAAARTYLTDKATFKP